MPQIPKAASAGVRLGNKLIKPYFAEPRNKLEAKLSREKKTQTDLEDEVKFVKSKLDHTIYDMLYLILARRNSAVLLTMDKKLKGAALKSGVEVSLEL